MIIQFINRIIPKKTTHPGAKHRWQFPVVGRQLICVTNYSGNLDLASEPKANRSKLRPMAHRGVCRPNLRDMRDYSLEGSEPSRTFAGLSD
jgi:hypothetical protein